MNQVKTHVKAHKEEPLSVTFGNGKVVKLQPGESGEYDLTGDEIGYVAGALAAQAEDRLIRGTGGSASSVEQATEAPVGSKKWLQTHPPAPSETETVKPRGRPKKTIDE